MEPGRLPEALSFDYPYASAAAFQAATACLWMDHTVKRFKSLSSVSSAI
jgi:hypothetical protein